MRRRFVSIAVFLMGVAFAATGLADPAFTINTDDDPVRPLISCKSTDDPPDPGEGFSLICSGGVPNAPHLSFSCDGIVACYAPVWGAQSPGTNYVNAPNTYYTSGEVTPSLAEMVEDQELSGAYIWFECGQWEYHEADPPLPAYWSWNRHGGGEWFNDWYWCSRNGVNCFAEGTPVMTPKGAQPIERLEAGDFILSSAPDDPQSPVVSRRVQDVIRRRGQLLDIAVNGQVIRATHEHPFYVKAKGWTKAAALTAGDLLRSHDNRWLPVESAVAAAEAPVYNVSVEKSGTYFVGARDWGFSVWVYGACNRAVPAVEQVVRSNRVSSHFHNRKTAIEQLISGPDDRRRSDAGFRTFLDEVLAANRDSRATRQGYVKSGVHLTEATSAGLRAARN